jgi:16S rRNA (adenine1518-N6/adenine1519-N6)-dimethyltransferase
MLEAEVRQALKRAGIRPSRGRGQHFLIYDSVLANVLNAARLTGEEHVLEIGPGLGTLTRSLAARCHRLHAFELDDALVRYLDTWVLPDTRNVVLHDKPFNKYVMAEVAAEVQRENRPFKIVTNLPYQISSAFLHTVVEYAAQIELAVVMLQREVAQRCCARPGEAGFSSFSLYLQTFLQPSWVCHVPAQAFFPQPKVESAVITLKPLPAEEQPQPRNRELYLKLIESVFHHRRKQLVNSVQRAYPHLSREYYRRLLESVGIDPEARPQTLSMSDYVRLADALADANSNR